MRCPGCGQPRWESMSPEDEGPDYIAQPVRCRACEARDALASAEHQNASEQGMSLSGLYFAVREVNTTNGHS